MKTTKITEKFDSEGKLIERVTVIEEGDPIINPVPYVPYIPSWPYPGTTGPYIGDPHPSPWTITCSTSGTVLMNPPKDTK